MVRLRKIVRHLGTIVVACALLAACGGLKSHGAKSGRLIGIHLESGLINEHAYAKRLGEFSLMEGFHYWIHSEPHNNQWDFTLTDWLFGPNGVITSRPGVTAKSFSLISAWDKPEDKREPDYVKTLNTTQLRAELKDHVQTLVRRYPSVKIWNLVNEPFQAPDGNGAVDMRNNVFRQKLGKGWIRDAVQYAHQANPDATFVAINEFNADAVNAKSTKMLDYYRDYLIGAIPSAHLAVGLQMHIDSCPGGFTNPTGSEVQQNMERFANLGIQVHITEMDYGVRCINGSLAHKLDVQKDKYYSIVRACMNVARCKAFSTWGVGDPDSWIRWLGHEDWPLLFDDNYKPKPAYHGVVQALKGQ